jgi:hypothetical protein
MLAYLVRHYHEMSGIGFMFNLPWTEEEDRLILELRTRFGAQWKLMAKYVERKISVQIKNR